jgi:hypothetical protein
MPASSAYNACMKSIKTTQYTVRQVPKRLDEALRLQARQQGKSLNDVTLEALTHGLGLADDPIVHHDLDALAGSWVDDPAFDKAIEAQDQIDPAVWK